MEIFPVFTERLILRRFQEKDLSAFVAYRSDPEIARYQSWTSISEAEARSFIREQQRIQFGAPGEWFQIALAQKETDDLLGDVSVHMKPDDPTIVEIGFTLAQENQGKGYASEAVRKVLWILFEGAWAEQVEGVTDSRNEKSVRLLQRMGMRKEKEAQWMFKGSTCAEYTFVIRKSDWLARNAV